MACQFDHQLVLEALDQGERGRVQKGCSSKPQGIALMATWEIFNKSARLLPSSFGELTVAGSRCPEACMRCILSIRTAEGGDLMLQLAQEVERSVARIRAIQVQLHQLVSPVFEPQALRDGFQPFA
jgi:hypothetical protein